MNNNERHYVTLNANDNFIDYRIKIYIYIYSMTIYFQKEIYHCVRSVKIRKQIFMIISQYREIRLRMSYLFLKP